MNNVVVLLCYITHYWLAEHSVGQDNVKAPQSSTESSFYIVLCRTRTRTPKGGGCLIGTFGLYL